MNNIILSSHQKDAVSKIAQWYNHPTMLDKKAFILNGYAGVGKTSIAKLLPELVLNSGPESIAYATPTGKAASQLRKKGCQKVTTLHKLLYSPLEKNRTRLLEITATLRDELIKNPQGDSERALLLKRQLHQEHKSVATPSWQVKKPDLCGVKLLVVDESSMCDEKIYNDLMSLNTPILFMGDPFQLPPVFGTSPIMTQAPDFVLTEIHRQSEDSPILRVATALRNGEYPSVNDNTEKFQIISADKANYELYATADQILCGRNKTRRALNFKLRRRLIEQGKVGLSELPVAVGDRIVFLRNDHDEGVYNGTTAAVASVTSGVDDGHASLILDATDDSGGSICSYEVWAGITEGLDAHEAPRRAQVIDYSYALTVHKAQGNEWPSVLVHHEPMAHGNDALRWLYTAITRAQDKCTIVSKDMT